MLLRLSTNPKYVIPNKFEQVTGQKSKTTNKCRHRKCNNNNPFTCKQFQAQQFYSYTIKHKYSLFSVCMYYKIESMYSQTSVHECLGSSTIRFTNKFSEHKVCRMMYCVSSNEHASRQLRGAISWEYQRRQYS